MTHLPSALSPIFPLRPIFRLGEGICASPEEVLTHLSAHINPDRRARIDEVSRLRTYSVVPVCDNLYDGGNIAAVMRSAEALGFQEFHSILLHDTLKRSRRITTGADKWLDIHLWHDRSRCLDRLTERGYRIVATQIAPDCLPIDEVDFTHPTAIFFGNEHDGVSEEVLERADVRCILPMDGFAGSYNISVAAALALYHIRADRLERQGRHADLSAHERRVLQAEFYLRSIKRSRDVLRGLLHRARDEEER